MKLVKSIVIALITLTAFNLSAQTVDDIVSKNIESMGGGERLAGLKSIKMTGNMAAGGNDIALTLLKLHKTGMRLDLDIMGTSNYQILNNKSGSTFFPVMGMTEPKEMEAEQYKSGVHQLDVQGPLYDYKEKGNKIELLGKEAVDGSDAYKLKVTYSNGHSAAYFIDAKTYRLVKSVSKQVANGQEMEVENIYSDYKQNADGYWFPYSMTNAQGTITFDKIETNIEVKENIFSN
jgi:hypothetical protein